MKEQKEKTGVSVQENLFIPQALLDMAGIPPDSSLTVEAIPGALLIGAEEPLKHASRPYLRLFSDLGIEPEEVSDILKKGGYL